MNRKKIYKGVEVAVAMRVKTIQRNAATGEIVSESPFKHNLVMDGGLNALARSTNATNPASMFAACRVGSGSTSDKFSSGGITFTQAGTTLTASAPFFTAGMVGYLFKWGSGTGGAESYINAFTSSTQVTLADSATVAVPEVGVVWNVTRTALETLLYSSSTYETTAGSCGTTVSGALVTHKRTINFAQQVASYNVNEVGYFNSTSGSTIFGRVVLGATEVVAPTNFLQLVLELDVTYSPSAPTAVVNVGTNIDTAGNAMIEQFRAGLSGQAIAIVATNGTVTAPSGGQAIDGSATCSINGAIATYTQNATVGASAKDWGTVGSGYLTFQNTLNWTFASSRGKMTLTSNATISTAGQTLYGVGMGGGSSPYLPCFDVKFTSTYALPTGSFLPQCVFAVTYNRLLNN
jgi:hypothetical protein